MLIVITTPPLEDSAPLSMPFTLSAAHFCTQIMQYVIRFDKQRDTNPEHLSIRPVLTILQYIRYLCEAGLPTCSDS